MAVAVAVSKPPNQDEEIPTIELKQEYAIQYLDMFKATTSVESDSNGSCSIDVDDWSKDDDLPVLTATNVDTFTATCAQTVLYGYHENSTDGDNYHYDFGANQSKRRRRAAFLSATVTRQSKDTKLGLGVKSMEDGSLQISALSTGPEFLLSESPFQVGDTLVSVNNISCEDMDLAVVADIFRQATGMITLVAENKAGDPQLIESMVMKSSRDTPTGLGMATTRTSQTYKVSSIKKDGLFSESLLSRRDTIRSINGFPCEYLKDANEAANIVRSAEKTVTLVVERRSDNAAVVAMAA